MTGVGAVQVYIYQYDAGEGEDVQYVYIFATEKMQGKIQRVYGAVSLV